MRTTKLLAFSFLLLAFGYLACKKTDVITDKSVRPTDRFFMVPSDAPTQIKAIAKALEKQNDEHHYLSSITKRIGYPIWDKARIINLDSKKINGRSGADSTGEVVYIPFARDIDNHVNSILAVRLTHSDTVYRLLSDYNYRKFGFDTTNHSKWNARDVFHMFTSFDYSVFGHTQFIVKDPRLVGKDTGFIRAELVPSPFKANSRISLNGIAEECDTYHIYLTCTDNLTDGSNIAKATIVPMCYFGDITICTAGGGAGTTSGTSSTPGGEGGAPTGGSSGGTPTGGTEGTPSDGTSGTGWIGTGTGTGTTYPGTGDNTSGSGGWYSGGSNPCAGTVPIARESTNAPLDGCGSGWTPVDGSSGTASNMYDPVNPFANILNPVDGLPNQSLVNNGVELQLLTPNYLQNPILIGKSRRDPPNVEDMAYGKPSQYGDPTGIDPYMLWQSDDYLFSSMQDLFDWCTYFDQGMTDVANKMIQKFRNNTGGTFSDPVLDNRITKEAQFRDYIKIFGKTLHERLQTVNYDISKIQEPINMMPNRPIFNGWYNKFHGLMITINDTEETDIEYDPSDYHYLGNGKWSLTVSITIHDHFGLDKHDALKFQGAHPGFAAWWILQHQRGYVPFETVSKTTWSITIQ